MLKHIKHWWGRNAYSIAISLTILVLILSLASFSSVGVKIIKVKNSDKLAHIVAYLFLSFSWLFATRNRFKTIKSKVLIIICLVVFGIILEALQEGLTTYRKADLYDVFANSLGILVAAISFNKVRIWLNSMLK